MMTARQAADKIRTAIRKQGINPKGCVRVRSTDYTTEVEVDLRAIYGDARDEIESAIDEIDAVTFTFEIL